ncbi:hypothetical protein J2S13_001456 [Oikeobacillus pervagus]|uniref:Uncharacterized protein n=1 Tax=Oikeobacillus pervagus TaxID=1325931 RepID=A0AAJ1WGH1_9BACI|nr:hypothetical protein [Oikeobacillus pervagus]MDQ0215057.1 hypothetical protein [Oikeobacillus pervagus]
MPSLNGALYKKIKIHLLRKYSETFKGVGKKQKKFAKHLGTVDGQGVFLSKFSRILMVVGWTKVK